MYVGNKFQGNGGNIYIKSAQTDSSAKPDWWENAGVDITGQVKNFSKGDITIENSGKDGVKVAGLLSNQNGNVRINNTWGDVDVSGKIKNSGATRITNTPEAIYVGFEDGPVVYEYSTDTNSGVNISGEVFTPGTIVVTNTGDKGINITGSVINHGGEIQTNNTGIAGTKIDSTGLISAGNYANINDNSKGGTQIKGHVKSDMFVNINQKGGGNVVIGDATNNNNYVTAGKDININVENGSILNYAGIQPNAKVLGIKDAKTLLVAGGDLNMDVKNGTIGQEVGAG